MSKMTVIQLLNKIANDEKVPKKIKYEGRIWEYDSNVQDYMNEDIVEYLFAKMFGMKTERVLNCEVEIIEEDKKIRKIKVDYSPDIEEKIFYEDGDKPNHCILGDAGTELLINKINEIIDYIMEEK